MTGLYLTVGLGPANHPDGRTISSAEDNVAELTRTIAAAYAARGTARWVRGEHDLALADLDAALRHDPDNGEARLVHAFVRRDRGDAVAESDLDERRVLGLDEYGPVPGRSYLMAGYAVMADSTPYADLVDGLVATSPLTPEGRSEAIGLAQFLARTPSLREEEVGGRPPGRPSDFDALVLEIRAVARVVYVGEAMDDEGDRLPRKREGATHRL